MLKKTLPAALAALLLMGIAGAAAIGAAGPQTAPRYQPRPLLETPAAGPAALPEAPTTIQRTFVSTSGSDANACTRALPCRGFAAAIAETTEGGEVVALDSGGYGAFTIDKAVTIAGAPGEHVAITGFGGATIDVNADPGDTVVLRNLYLSGLGAEVGILFQQALTLYVESVVASGFSYGLYAGAEDARLVITDSRFRRNVDGVIVNAALHVEIADSRADRNDDIGFFLTDGADGSIVRSSATGNPGGFWFEGGVVFTLSDSLADGNEIGVAVNQPGTDITLSAVVLSNNAETGLSVGVGSESPVARIGGSTVSGNGTGLERIGGILETFGDNLVRGNATSVAGTLTAVPKT